MLKGRRTLSAGVRGIGGRDGCFLVDLADVCFLSTVGVVFLEGDLAATLFLVGFAFLDAGLELAFLPVDFFTGTGLAEIGRAHV